MYYMCTYFIKGIFLFLFREKNQGKTIRGKVENHFYNVKLKSRRVTSRTRINRYIKKKKQKTCLIFTRARHLFILSIVY